MSHSVHPYAHRLGILRDWKSRWFAGTKDYSKFLKTDVLLREFLEKRLKGMFVDGIEMERSQNMYRIIIKTGRPGMVIGRNGEGSAKLKVDILKEVRRKKLSLPKELRIDIEEVKNPDAHAAIVAEMIIEGLEKRFPFRRVLKQAIEKVIANREVEGIKIRLSGRLGGAEMSRVESLKQGRIPLQTLRADIDYAQTEANMTYGKLGVKVWIYRGEVFEKEK